METRKVRRSKTFQIEDYKEFNSKFNTFIKEIKKEDIISIKYSAVATNGVITHCANIVYEKEITVKPKTEAAPTTAPVL